MVFLEKHNILVKEHKTYFLNQNAYELTSLNADLLFQNNLYSQGTSRQVCAPGFRRRSIVASSLVLLFTIRFNLL